MKKKFLLKSVMIMYLHGTLCLFTLCSQAQDVIMELNYTPTSSSIRAKPIMNTKAYTKVSESTHQTVYSRNNHSLNTRNSATDADSATLTIIFEYNPDLYSPSAVVVIDENGYDNTQYWEGENPVTLFVPVGNYDIVTESWVTDTINHAMNGLAYVIKELIDIESDTTIIIHVSDARNHIAAELYNEAGELLEPGIISGDFTQVIGGSATVLATNHILFTPSDYIVSSFTGNWGFKFDDHSQPNEFYINNVSERYTVLLERIGLSYSGAFYFTKYTSTNISGSLTLQNNPDDYILHQEKFQVSPVGESTANHYKAFQICDSWKGRGTGNGWSGYDKSDTIDPAEGIELFIDNPLSGNPIPEGYDLLINPCFVDQFEIVTDPEMGDYEVATTINGTAILKGDDGHVIYAANGLPHAGNFSFNMSDVGEIMYLPFHPKFSYSSGDNTNIVQGNNTPVASVIAQNYYADWLPGKYSYLLPQYIGRYGETRSRNDSTTVEMNYNNQNIFSGRYSDFESFMFQWVQQLNPAGLLDVTFTNLNSRVDSIPGKNITRVVYDWTKEDWTAPTVQMLQFRDASGNITDRFTSGTEGTLRLAAGDFEYINRPYNFKYTEGNTVELLYSKHDQNEWTAIELIKYPEAFFMPGYGDYYEASLASVQTEGNNVWYDVKIVCTDVAGNSQTQTISPAFLITNTLGIKENPNSANHCNLGIYPNPISDNSMVNFSLAERSAVKLSVYNLDGQLISQLLHKVMDKGVYRSHWETSDHVGNALKPGIYLLTLQTGSDVETIKVVVE